MTKKERLEKLNKEMSDCTKCALRRTCKQVVPGAGNPKAQILFIGEAPGKKETLLGTPFIGSSGKILNKMLTEIKIKREDVYLTNICKCRPPENRDPFPAEALACWPWLEKEIEIIEPKIIVTLGRHALNRFLPEAKIYESHGKVFSQEFPKIGTRFFYILYHPAAARQNKKIRTLFKKDFQKIPLILKRLKK